MSIPVSELRRWLETIPNEASIEDIKRTILIGINEGGLTLQVVGNDQTYLEVGGLPEGENNVLPTSDR